MADRNKTGPRAARGKRRLARILRSVAVLVALGGIGYAAWTFLPPLMKIDHVVISGTATVSREEVMALAAFSGGENLLSVNISKVAANVIADPRIESVRVKRSFPRGLHMTVTERRAVATILVQAESGTRTVLVDASGVVYAFADNREIADKLPVLSGVKLENFHPGMRLPPEFGPTLLSLGTLEANVPTLVSVFSEIRIVKLAAGDVELLLYPVHVPIPVRTKAVLDADTLRSIVLVLDILKDRQSASPVEEVDFRTGTVVYRTKEGHPG